MNSPLHDCQNEACQWEIATLKYRYGHIQNKTTYQQLVCNVKLTTFNEGVFFIQSITKSKGIIIPQ